MSKKNGEILDVFWKLSDQKDNVRLDAATKILTSVRNNPSKQENIPTENGDSEEKAETPTSSLTYCFERLIRGLASTRQTSLQGFFVTLVELLRQHEDLVANAFETIDRVLHIKGSKSEEGDYMRGKMLCFSAIIRSGKANVRQLAQIITKLLSLASKRSYLNIPSHKTIIESLEQIKEEEFIEHIWPHLSEAFKAKKELTLESVWLLMEIYEKYPNVFNKARTHDAFDRKKLIEATFVQEVSEVLMAGNINVRTLFKLPVVQKVVSAINNEGLLDQFWLKHIEPKTVKSSAFKSSIGVIVFNAILINVKDSSKISTFLTNNLVDVFMANLSKTEKTEIEALILSSFDKLITMATADPALVIPILQKILTGSGNIAFDKATGSSIVQRLINVSDTVAVKFVAGLYLDAVLGCETSVDVAPPSSKDRAFAAHQLAKLMSHPKINQEVEWRVKVINQLLAVSLFDIKKPLLDGLKPLKKPFSREIRTEIQTVFFKALDLKASTLVTLCEVLYKVAEATTHFMANPKAAVPVTSLDAPSIKAWKKMMETVGKILESGDEKRVKEDVVFQLLFIHVGFQLFSDAPMAIDVLSDLHICHVKSKSKKTKKATNTDEPVWIEVVVDLLLSLLSQNKHILRRVVSSVMTVLSPHINDTALQTIIDAIHPAKDKNGSDQMNGGDKMDEGDESDDDDYETMSESESDDEDEAEEEEEEEGDDEGDDDDEDEEGEDDEAEEETAEVDEEFKNRVKEALGSHAAGVESDQDDIDPDDMDEEDLAKMDLALSKIFKSICKKKSKVVMKKEREEALGQMHFKIRVLDMIDIYLSHDPKLSHTLFLIQPIIAAMEEAIKRKDHAPLQSRLMSTLKKLTNLKKLPLDAGLTKETFSETVQSLIEWSNNGSPLFPLLCHPIPLFAQACFFVLKYGEKYEEERGLQTEVIEVYSKAMEEFFQKNHYPLPMQFFMIPLISGCKGVARWAQPLIHHAFSSDTRPYRKTQALSLLTALLKSPSFADAYKKKELNTLLKSIAIQLVNEVTQCIGSDAGAKPRYLCDLFTLIHTVHNAGPDLLDDIKDPLDKIRDVIPKNRHFQDVKKAFNKVAVAFAIDPVQHSEKKKATKNAGGILGDNFDEVKTKLVNGDKSISNATQDGAEQQKKKKKKKKKPSLEALKKRKERKIFELEGQFKGQEMPSFTGIILNDNLNFVPTTAAAEAESKKTAQTTDKKASKKRKPTEEVIATKPEKIKKKKKAV